MTDLMVCMYNRMDYKSERDGDKKFEKGKDAVTTGIFQWSKDYASGAHNFQEAGTQSTSQ